MLISIVVPVYRRIEWLEKCLSSLSAQACPEGVAKEVLVVDDGSPNKEDFSRISGKFNGAMEVRYLFQGKKGPAAAKNLGIKNSSGEVLCFIDDDSICAEGYLERIAGLFLKDPRLGMANGKLLSYWRDEGSLALMLENSVYKPRKSWATCNIAYRRSVFDKVGLFDENYKLASWEDNDLGFRASWLKGIKHVFCPQAVVYHVHENTMEEFKEKALRNGQGLRQFFGKFFWRNPLLSLGIAFYALRDVYLVLYPMVSLLRCGPNKVYLRFVWALGSLKGFLRG